VENYETFDSSPITESSSGYVVGATPFATRTKRLRGVEFETIIFDEASQITLPLAVMGMLAGKRFVFIGDQKQLPPVLMTRFGSRADPGPDFWVLHDDGRSLLLKVSAGTVEEARAASQPNFFQSLLGKSAAATIGVAERETLLAFVARVAGARDLATAVAFPNVSEADLRKAVASGIVYAGKETLAPERFRSWIDAQLSSPLSGDAIVALRKAMAPEVVIPAHFTVRSTLERNIDAQLADYLLDYDQEWAVKLDLDLSQDAESTAKEFGPRLVNGVAGSGKSLILLYRANLLRQLYPDKRILVITHNRALIGDLEGRYLDLSGGDRTVEWRTFQGWCASYWPAHRCYFSFADIYAKVERNLRKLPPGIDVYDPPDDQKIALALDLAEIAAWHGITLFTCAEDFSAVGPIQRGSCVDKEILDLLWPEKARKMKLSSNRGKCGCYDSRDIGAYDTCPHGCIYCYVVLNRPLALKNYREHDPDHDALIKRGPKQSPASVASDP